MPDRRLFRVTAAYLTHTTVRHYLTRRTALQQVDRLRAGYYVEPAGPEDDGHRVPPAESVLLEVSDPVTWPSR